MYRVYQLIKKISVFDCNIAYTSRNFVWTAITRVRDLNNVIYFEHSENEVKRLEESKLKQYLSFKIENYKKQDTEAKRDVEWLIDQINKNEYCSVCMSAYYCVLDNKNDVMCNITVDRLQSDEVHTIDNCHL